MSREFGYPNRSVERVPDESILLDNVEPIAPWKGSASIQLDDVSLHQPSKAKRPPFWYTDAWLYDCLALGLATLVFVALVLILVKYDRQPNPLWMSIVTLNTIASVASMLFRVGIMLPVANCISQLCWVWYAERQRPIRHFVAFDQASRGPVGALYALFTGAWR
jgi:hypothetical protein